MRFENHFSISFKITLLVLCGTALVFIGVLGYSYLYTRNLIFNETKKSTVNLTRSVANQIDKELRGIEEIPQTLACVLGTLDLDEPKLLKVLERTVKENPEIYGIAVAFEAFAFDPSKRAFAPYYYQSNGSTAYTQLATPSYNYFQLDWYHIPKQLRAPAWTEPYFDEGGGNILMSTYSVPFFEPGDADKKGKVRGIVTADVSLTSLARLVDSVNVAKTGYCFLVSGSGTFITHPRPEMVMRESIFSISENLNMPAMRKAGLRMLREDAGFLFAGPSITGRDTYLAFARIHSPGWALGAIFPKNELYTDLNKLHYITEALSVVGILALLAVSVLVARSIAKPLKRMAVATSKVAAGDLDIDLSDIRSRDEVGRLAKSFMEMTEGLKQRDFIRNTFGRYLTQEVVNRLLESKDGLRLGGERREISILMSDIRGFTALTAHMQPEQVISFLNRYLGKMLEILLEYRGTIDEIIGDGILAFFGAPEPLPDHPARAVACALKMQAAMDEINAINQAEGLPHIEMGVAVNTGNVVVGNIGSEKRTKYGAVGAQVNFTGRMESFTVGGQLLISSTTHDKLQSILDIRNVLQVEMKGVTGKVSLYDVRGIGGPYEVRLESHDVTPVPVKEVLRVRVRRLDHKTVSEDEIDARITHSSITSAILVFDQEVHQWENLRMVLLDREQRPLAAEMYAKVLSVTGIEQEYEAVVRFTLVSADAYKVLRDGIMT